MQLYNIKNLALGILLSGALAFTATSCSDDDSVTTYPIVINH